MERETKESIVNAVIDYMKSEGCWPNEIYLAFNFREDESILNYFSVCGHSMKVFFQSNLEENTFRLKYRADPRDTEPLGKVSKIVEKSDGIQLTIELREGLSRVEFKHLYKNILLELHGLRDLDIKKNEGFERYKGKFNE